MTEKHLQRNLGKDDRREVSDKDSVWENAKVSKNKKALRPWHRDFWRFTNA